jgi:hypothetical protein
LSFSAVGDDGAAHWPQLFVGVPASAQQTSSGGAQTPWLHQEVSALRPAVAHAQQVGWQSVGSVQALPGAPSLQVTTLVAPAQVSFSLALAIEPASVTITAVAPQRETPWSPLEQDASAPTRTTQRDAIVRDIA